MPKAVILFSFKKGEDTLLMKNLTTLKFDKKEGRRIIFSKEFPADVVGKTFNLNHLKIIKKSLEKSASKPLIESPIRIWARAFNETKALPASWKEPIIDPATGKQEENPPWGPAFLKHDYAIDLAAFVTTEGGKEQVISIADTGDSTMDMEEETTRVPASAQPIVAEMKQEESQSQGIVDDDFDVDALVSGLAKTKLGGRRRRNTRRGKKLRRRYSRKA
jgi:hypothetical protein